MPKHISVIGLGYLGVTQAAVLASLGHSVIGVDPDVNKISKLNCGELPFFEPGLQELLEVGIQTGRMHFVSSFDTAMRECEAHFLCVGTPSKLDGSGVDTKQLFDAIDDLAPFLREQSVIIGRSTVPVGTSTTLEDYLASITKTSFDLIWNPEFLSEGTAVRDSLLPERIVIGSNSDRGETMLREIYKDIISKNVPVLTLDRQTSELVKIASNAYLALKITFINGVAQIAEKSGASTSQLADAMGLDTRIGRKFLNNGLGFGGGCLPKDLEGFSAIARDAGANHFSELLDAVKNVNSDRRKRVKELAEELLQDLRGMQITVLGAAFKPGTDDIRSSPALQLAEDLRLAGAQVVIHDPIALPKVSLMFPDLIQRPSAIEAISGASLIILATDWLEYLSLDPAELGRIVKSRFFIDARNSLEPPAWREAGWKFLQLGEG